MPQPMAMGQPMQQQAPMAHAMAQPMPVAQPVPALGLPTPPFGAPPPGLQGGFGPVPAAEPLPPGGPYGPAPVAQPQPAATAGRCDFGHDIALGSSYCNFGHPIALGDMKLAGGDAFGATSYPTDSAGGAGALPPTGAMSPFPAPAGQDAGYQPAAQPPAPSPAAAYGAPQPVASPTPGYGGAPQPDPSPAPGYGGAPQPPVPVVPMWAGAPQPNEPFAATAPATQGKRQLRAFLYSFHTDHFGAFWPLYMGRNPIGRAGSGETVDIEIADPTTSSRHAVLLCDLTTVTLEDEGSTNGTFVNDQPLGIRGRAELRDGDRVRFGAYNATIRMANRQ